MKTTGLFSIIIVIFMFSGRSYAQNWDQIVKTCASDRNAQDYYGKSVAIDGDFAIVGAWEQDKDASGGGTTLLDAGAAYILKNTSGTWVEIQKIVASDRGAGANFGYSVDISGDYAVIGAWTEDYDAVGTDVKSNAGSAYIFYNNAGIWEQNQKIVALDRDIGDNFGSSVSIDGDFVVVGAYNEDEDVSDANTLTNAGSIYVFEKSGANWTQTQKIVPSDRTAADFFGHSVDVCGDYIIAGANNKSENSIISAGAAYVFYYNGSTWSEIQKLVAPVQTTQCFFGYDVAISNNFAVVGAYGEGEGGTLANAGSAYIYSNPGAGANLTFHSKIIASDRQESDRFGCAVDIDGNYIIIGANLEDHDENGLNELNSAGSAYIYNYNGTNWTQEQKIVSLDRRPSDFFGCDVAISNNFIITGADNQDYDAEGNNNRPGAGATYIFHNCREINLYQGITQIPNDGTFDFGYVAIGNSSSELTFTIENTGMDNLILDGTPKIEISGTNASNYVINQTATSSPIIPGGSTTFTIIFTPSLTGLHTANISISNNDYDENPYSFTMTGTSNQLSQTINNFNSIPTKTYGDNDFTVSATASSGLDVIFTSSNNNIATCGGTNGSTITIINAGTCQINANQPGNGSYLAATQVSQTLTVNKKPITVTADAGQTKEYGDSDPVFTYTVTVGSLETGDSFSGVLSRNGGETVGQYNILIGTLSAGSNYEISFVTNNFTITKRTIYVTADANQSKIYGNPDPSLTYSFTPNLIGGDVFTGVINRIAGNNVGFYAIQQGPLSLGSNYIIDFTSNDFEIIAKTITVTPNANQIKTYGTTDPSAFTYSTNPTLASGDTFTGKLSREVGEDVGLYAITIGTLEAGDNYIMSIADENFEITAKLIIINAHNNQYKAYGDEDPVFSYSALPLPISGDEYTGGLSRESGEELGIYTITQGTLSLGANYNMSFNSADFEIKIKNLMIIVDENQSKEYGEPDPVLTFTPIPDIAPWDNFSGALEREPGELIGIYEISQGTLSLDDNDNYNIILFTGADFEITKITPIITWENPADINYGTALSATQLNATANISGSFAYNPDFNTILEIGDNQALNVEFTPTDNLYYNNTITTVYINVLLDIGVDEYHSNIKIYPNPAKDYVNIVQENTLYEYLKVYDITGKIVIELNLDDLITCLDISNLPSGVYFIALKPADSSPEVRAKLVKTDN